MEEIPVGELSLDSLRGNRETSWFALGYDLFSFDDGESYRRILSAQPEFELMEILAFVGTWCPDCQEHLPGFARIADTVRFPRERLKVFGMDRGKSFPGGSGIIARYGILRLPTFIFLKEGKEIGRITESPRESLLKDWAQIVFAG